MPEAAEMLKASGLNTSPFPFWSCLENSKLLLPLESEACGLKSSIKKP
jgi:hypothetical protein